MANPRPPLDEATLRETVDDLLARVTHQQRIEGRLPDVRAAEDFIHPIVAKVAASHEDERRHDLVRKEAPARQEEILTERRQARKLPDGWRLDERALGEIDWNLGTNQFTGPAATRRRRRREGPAVKATRLRFRFLAGLPEWRDRIMTAYGELLPAQREQVFRKILTDSVKIFGDPRVVGY